ncbi:transcriptional regulator [Nucisporomicrobium flavum]|uniref:transcriptional regulator n=1 Tax=Nucisporomicrobium flavum TaxID=2785915 RepID=UPI0018F5A269|nr:transcriptional regulator [Nucisporomicrobium flavum]
MPAETPEQIAQTFQVSVELVLAGRFDLGAYPHRHLVVAATRGFWYSRLAQVLAATEMLTSAGFELVHTIEFDAGNAVCAVLRRT